jgi:hypothetical protein
MQRTRKTVQGLAQHVQLELGRPLTFEEEYLLEIVEKYCNDEPYPEILEEDDQAA